MEMAPEKEEVVEQRVDMVYEIFKEVMQRPRIKPVFDKHHPEAHIKKATDEAHFRHAQSPCFCVLTRGCWPSASCWKKLRGKKCNGAPEHFFGSQEEHCEEAAVEAPKPAKKKKKRNDSDSSDSSDDSDDDSDDGEAAPVVRRLVVSHPPRTAVKSSATL